MSYQEMINGGIKRLRLSKKLTQEQFAEKINMSVQGYRNLEHNKYQATAETVDKVCDVFNISPVDLLLPEPQKDLAKIIELINNKLGTCSIDKLIRINNMIDLM
jgi:transcriptional regulator with XRE-family HTH domain